MDFLLFIFTFLCLYFPHVRTDTGLRSPPHISGEVIAKYVAKLGDTVKLDCPIDSSSSPIYEWMKDGEAITPTWERFRASGKRLRIRGIVVEDAGTYVCKAVNGYGNTQISTKLLVYDENGELVGGVEEEMDLKQSRVIGIRPALVHMSRSEYGQSFRQALGSSLQLRCQAEGQPVPIVSWLKIKDGTQLSRGTGSQLNLTAISFEDSGMYICRATNDYGQVNTSFLVQVVEQEIQRPTVFSLEPSNVTLAAGGKIHFRCHVRSDTTPNVKWLREFDEHDGQITEPVKVVGSKKYTVMDTSVTTRSNGNGTYLSELKRTVTSRKDSGAYICLATNAAGFNYSSSFLTVLSEPDSDPLLPVGILVAIPATVVLLFFAVALVICCLRRNQSQGNCGAERVMSTTTSTMYATPRDIIVDSHSGLHPFYNSRPASTGRNDEFDRFMSKDHSTPHLVVHKPQFSGFPTHRTSPNAYASVPICEGPGPPSSFGVNRAPPLPSRPNLIPPNCRDRNAYCKNQHALLTQPLLTQTASSSDSRDSRQSSSYPIEFGGHRQMEHWGSSGGSDDASADRILTRHNHQVRL